MTNKQPKTGVVPFYKNLGETPLQALNRLRATYPAYEKETLSYAGRLDPMAEGVLVVLVGEENKKRNDYLHLPKTYEAEMIFGLETDTYDILGKVVTNQSRESTTVVDEVTIKNLLQKYIGTFEQAYPAFSSRPVNGKPLFQWAREGKLNEVKIPTHSVHVKSLTLDAVSTISASEIIERIKMKIDLVEGDFRQKEILESWQHKLRNVDKSFVLAKMTIACSGGTYVRGIIHSVGDDAKTGAVTFSILRTKVGPVSIKDCIN